MLSSFKFKNYMSFSDNSEFNMLANSDTSHETDLVTCKTDKLSKARIIYGANASGKSSFLKAMAFVSSFMSMSNFHLDSTKIGVIPFKFCDNRFNKPSEFEISFYIDEIKYVYAFSCTRTKVIGEKLLIYTSAKPTTVFERTNTTEYKFLARDLKVLNEYKEKNTDNKLFLVTSATWNYSVTKPIVDYLMNKVTVISEIDTIWKMTMDKIVAENALDDFKSFCLNILNNADLSINDFVISSKKIKDLGEQAEMFSKVAKVLANDKEELIEDLINKSNVYNFRTKHTVSGSTYDLDLLEESLGTKQIFMLSTILYYVFKEGKVLFVDEIDKSLHPLLVEYIVKMFKDKMLNPKNAQLIATTHDTNLLNLDLFRRDDIWFTERNFETGSTEIFKLADFSPRKNENIEKAYLLGRFGAVPFIKGV